MLFFWGCRFVLPKTGSRARFCTSPFEKVSETAESAESVEESAGSAKDEADANEVLLEELKRQKRVLKMQLTKLYTRLMRLMSDETIDREAILIALKNVEEKKNGCSANFGRPDSYLRESK